MDFTFSPEQEALRTAVRSFLEREGGRELVRQAVEDEAHLPDALWDRMAELGWAGLLVPPDHGGIGLGLVDLVVVQEELGRRAFPGPFLSSAVQATLAALRLEATDLLPGLAAGTVRGTLALEELGSTEPLGSSVKTVARPAAADDPAIGFALEEQGTAEALGSSVDTVARPAAADDPAIGFALEELGTAEALGSSVDTVARPAAADDPAIGFALEELGTAEALGSSVDTVARPAADDPAIGVVPEGHKPTVAGPTVAADLAVDLAQEELGTAEALGSSVDTVARPATPAELAQGFVLEGHKPTVLDGDRADWVLVVARDETGLGTYLVEQPGAELVPGLDVTRRLTRLPLDHRRAARRVGPPGDQTELLQRVVDDVAVALCAETVGACEAALDLAVDYAKVRVQFDRPIGSFQAIRHKIVDMLHNLELARVATHYAAWASEVDDPERAAAAAMAKGFVGEAATMVTAETIQVHGGVGFTWDADCHLYYRRVKQNDALFGRSAWNRQRLATMILGET